MQKALMWKLAVLSVVLGVILIGVAAVGGLVHEREGRRRDVAVDIATSAGRGQELSGPLLVLPYTKVLPHSTHVTDANRQLVVLSKVLEIDSRLTTERRRRGIFEVPLAHAEHVLRGEIQLPPLPADATFGQPRLELFVGDLRGMGTVPQLRWDGKALEVEPQGPPRDSGFSAPLPGDVKSLEGRSIPFEVTLRLSGTEQVRWHATGESTTVRATSEWPHPSFQGSFLPTTRDVSKKGFTATWTVNRFATGQSRIRDLPADQSVFDSLRPLGFGVAFVEPVNSYSLSDRATKYGVLFLLLTFGAFFLFEMMSRLRIHPIQYLLVGVAQALFFILLLSLSEHLPFQAAYALATLGCVGIITVYTRVVLRSTARALGFGGGLLSLYGMLNVLLFSEDHALLLGALLLFALTALVMYVTRRIDWYGVEA